MKKRLMIAGGIAAVVVVGIWIAVAWAGRRGRNDYSGTVETREIQIGSKVGGRITDVQAEEGQMVKAGAVLVRFECDELQAQRTQAAAALAQAQADLDKMVRGNRPEEIEQAEATARATQAAYESARNGPRRQEIEQAQADLLRRLRMRRTPRGSSNAWRSWRRRTRFRGSNSTMRGTSGIRLCSGRSRRNRGWRCSRRAHESRT
jgi:multidrug efflux pump subunit AcrA (membrane-fusion protein)